MMPPDVLPFRPIEELVARRWPDPDPIRQDCAAAMDVPASAAWIAEVLDISRAKVLRFRSGGVGVYEADQLATHVGVHPSHVWRDAWWHADDPVRQLELELVAS